MMTRRNFVACAALGAAVLGIVALRSHEMGRPDDPVQAVSASVLPVSNAPASGANEFEVVPVETRVLGQQTWLRGGPAALRVIVTDHWTGKPVNANVTLTLQSLTNGKPT